MRVLKKWKRKSLYKKSLILFTVTISIIGVFILIYVYNTAIVYERNLVDNYITYLAESGKLTDGIKDNMFPISEYEKSNAKITDGVKKLYKSDNLKIKKNTKESTKEVYVYDLYNGDKLISTVSLKRIKSYTRMAILTIDEWEIVDSKNYFENGVYSYEIVVPSSYQVYVNDKQVSEDLITSKGDVSGLEKLTKYVEINPSKTYKIDNLVYEPKIKILDGNKKEVNFEVKDNKVVVNKDFKEIANYEDAKKYIKDNFDVLKIAENWSLFMSKDLIGSNYGLSTLSPYLIKGSEMYDYAYSWSHGIDITFTSNHTLQNPPFTNEKVNNCVIYNENAFSCEVYLEKNMVVRGRNQVDTMHDRLYFIYYNNAYRLIELKSIVE